MADYLICTDCGKETDTTVDSLYEPMSRTKAGKRRKRTGWLKTLNDLVCNWRCNGCLDHAEAEMAGPP